MNGRLCDGEHSRPGRRGKRRAAGTGGRISHPPFGRPIVRWRQPGGCHELQDNLGALRRGPRHGRAPQGRLRSRPALRCPRHRPACPPGLPGAGLHGCRPADGQSLQDLRRGGEGRRGHRQRGLPGSGRQQGHLQRMARRRWLCRRSRAGRGANGRPRDRRPGRIGPAADGDAEPTWRRTSPWPASVRC